MYGHESHILSPGTAFELCTPSVRTDICDPQSVIVRVDVQDRLADGQEGPESGSGNPSVLGVA